MLSSTRSSSHTRRAAGGPDRRLLAAKLGDRTLEDADLAALRGLFVRTGALDRTEQRIGRLAGQALQALHRAAIEPEAAGVLRALAGAATERSG